MTRLVDTIEDATKSRLANLVRKAGGGVMTLYAIRHRQNDTVVLVVATCAENALVLIRETGLEDWELSNTTTRRVQKAVESEPTVVTAFRIDHQRGA